MENKQVIITNHAVDRFAERVLKLPKRTWHRRILTEAFGTLLVPMLHFYISVPLPGYDGYVARIVNGAVITVYAVEK